MELGLPVPQRKWYQNKRLVAGLLASVLGICVLCSASAGWLAAAQPRPKLTWTMVRVEDIPNGGQIKAALRDAHARYEAKRHGNITVAPMELESYTTQCYSWTGGSCRFLDCDESRQAQCVHKWGQGYFCMCPDGTCAGADGTCYAGNYEKVAHAVEIKNVQYPSEALYFPTSFFEHGVGASESADGNGYDDKFDLYRLPGVVTANYNDQVEFLVTTTGQPDWVAYATSGDDGSVGSVEMIKISRFWQDIQMASTIICKVPNGGSTYQMGSYDGYVTGSMGLASIHWFYISALSITGGVNEWIQGPPGPQGQWTFDPTFDDSMLHTCA